MTQHQRSDGDSAPSSDGPFDTGRAFGAELGVSDGDAPAAGSRKGASSDQPTTQAESGDDGRRPPRRRRRRSLGRAEGEEREPGAADAAVEAPERPRPERDETPDDDESASDSPRRSKGRRRKRRRKASTTEGGEAAESPETDAEPGSSEGERSAPDEGEGEGASPRKRARRRSGRRRKRADGPDPTESAADDSDDGVDRAAENDRDDDDEASGDGSKRSRRRGSRGGRRKRKSRSDEASTTDDDVASEEEGAVQLEVIPGEDDDLEALPPQPKKKARKRRTKAKGRAADEAEGEEDEPRARRRDADVVRDQVILVNAKDPEDTRVVVVQDGRIVDLQMTVAQHKSYVNDIYRGRVVNIESAIGAAFVDFGQGRNGFLHSSDVMDVYGEEDWSLDKLLAARTDVEEWANKGPKPEEFDGEDAKETAKEAAPSRGKGGKQDKGRARRGRGRRRTIDEVLEKGQLIVGQITKDAIGDKGPTLTTYISMPGRYLVLMPSLQRTGVSRKIEDEKERKRLKRILSGLSIPDGMGVIVRTAGIGKTKSEIKRDLDYLLAVWGGFSEKLVLGRSPAPLYQESDVAIRTMRDLFSSRIEKVLVDDAAVYERMLDFTKQLMPEHVDRIVLHEGTRPLFHEHGIEQDFEKVFARRVELPSGGSIMIDQTEALVAIDVNSGRTRDDGADFEDIALKTNLEAVPEIARQIRLRDMGGILVIDFIDMIRQASRRKVEKALRDCLVDDRARSKLGRISQFGLLEMTRQRLGPGLSKLLYDTCPACRGSGRRRTAQSRAQALLRRLGSALSQKGFTKIEILAHPDTIEWLKTRDRTQLKALEESSKRELVFKAVEDQTEDSVFHYLRADGREVRPGGRRKR